MMERTELLARPSSISKCSNVKRSCADAKLAKQYNMAVRKILTQKGQLAPAKIRYNLE
jgi:uncharacterized protein YecT (DUF1311 family)